MARGVELAIRAKNEAAKAIDSVASALDALKKSQDGAATSAGKTGSMLGDLSKSFVDLNNQVQALGALSKVVTQLDRAAEAVNRLESTVTQSAEDLAKLKKASADAGSSVDKLKSDVEQLTKVLADEQAKTAALRTERTNANRELGKAQTAYNSATAAVQNAEKASDKLLAREQEKTAALEQARQRQQQATAAYDQQVATQKQLESALTATKQALKSAEAAQTGIQTEAAKTAAALEQQTAALNDSKSALAQIKQVADGASAALGNVGTSQVEVAAAAKKAAVDIQAVNEALKRQAAAPRPLADTSASVGPFQAFKQQAQAVQEAKQAYQEAEAEATRLGRELATTATPTANLRAQFLLAKEASDAARKSYIAQAAALTELRGKSQGGFAAFEKTVAGIQSRAVGSGTVDPAKAWLAQAQTVLQQTQTTLPPIKKLNEATKDLGGASESAARANDKLSQSIRNTGDGSRQTLSLMQRLRGEVLSVAASYIGLYAAIDQLKGVVSSYQALEAAQSRLGVVFNQNTAKVANEIAFLREQSGRLGVSFSVLSDEYGKLAIAAKEANFSQAETRKLFLSVAEAGRVNKLSNEQLSGTFLALTQMMSKGKVSSEELRRQLGDRMSGAFNLFAQALGVTTAQLDEMLKKGEVVANSDTLLKFADRLNAAFGPQLASSLQTFTTEFGRLTSNIEQSQTRVAQGGFIESLGRLFKTLNEGFQSEAGQDFLLGLGAALGKLTDGVTVLVQNFDKLGVAIGVFLTLKVASVFTSMYTSSAQAGGAIATFAAAYREANASIAGSQAFRAAAVGMQVYASTTAAASGATGTFTASTVLATAASRAFGVALTGLRVVMATVRAAAVTLWAAIGGFPGLVITLITTAVAYLAGPWLTSVDDATEALDRHAKQLDVVRKAYELAKGDVKKWSDAIKEVGGLTANEIVDNQKKLSQELKNLRNEAKGTPTSNLLGSGVDPRNQQLNDLVKAFKEAKISAQEFETQLANFANANPYFQTKVIGPLLEVARKAVKVEDALKQSAATLEAFQNKANAATPEVLGLAEGVKTLNAALDPTKAEEYAKAMEKLGKAVPQLARSVELQKELRLLKDDFEKAQKNAQSEDEIFDAGERYRKAVQAAIAKFNTDTSKVLDLGGSKGLVERIIQVEGGITPGSPQSKTSSSRGIGQFIESTWLDYFDKAFPDRAELSRAIKLDRRYNPEDARKVIELYLQDIGKELASVDIPATARNLYAGYFLGKSGGKALLQAEKANPNQPVKNVVSQEAIAANPSILGGDKTVAQVLAIIDQKMGGVKALADISSSGATSQEEFNAKLKDALGLEEKLVVIQRQRAENDKLGVQAQYDANRELAIREAVLRKQAEAEAENKTLSEEQLQRVQDLAAAQYEAANAVKLQADLRKEAEQQVNEVLDKRKLILEQIELQKNLGNTAQVEQLRVALQAVNLELSTAIDKAIAFLKTLGDSPELQKVISGLELIRLKTQEVKKESKITGQAIDDVFLNSATSAFDQFSQAVAEGGNVFKAARNAFLSFASDFLKQIAKMIIQQAILNALGGTGSGGSSSTGSGIASFISSIFHEGGIAGGPAPARAVSPSVFANAMRYHVGGIAGMAPGLRPGEIPAILQRNEEVLTTDDPRHIFNGGGAKAAMPNIKVVNTFDAAAFMSEALNTTVGQKAFLNFVSTNRRAFQAAMS